MKAKIRVKPLSLVLGIIAVLGVVLIGFVGLNMVIYSLLSPIETAAVSQYR